MPQAYSQMSPAVARTADVKTTGRLSEDVCRLPDQSFSDKEHGAAKQRSAAITSQVVATFVAHLISASNGYVVGWSAVAIPMLKDNGTAYDSHPLDRPLTRHESSWLASASVLASVLGPAAWSWVSRRWGYKVAGVLVGVTIILADLDVLLAHSFPVLVGGRVLLGAGLGGIPVVASAYIAETAQEHVRGALGTFFALMFNAGILLVYLVGAVASYRMICAVAILLPALYLICFVFLPESPQYLLSKNKADKAAESLRWLRAPGYDVDAELQRIRSSKDRRSRAMTVGEFFRDRASRRALITVMVLNLNQQLDGGIVVLHYAVETLSAADANVSARWSAVVVAALQFVATFLSSALVDRVGRRPLLMASNTGMAVCLAAVGGYFFAQAGGADVSAIWWLPAVSLSMLLTINSFGVGSLLYVIITELFAPDAQPVAFSIGFGAHTVISAVVLRSYVVLVDWLQMHGCYWFYAASCILSNVYIFFFLPETKNRLISDIVSEISGKRKKRKSNTPFYSQFSSVGTRKCSEKQMGKDELLVY